MAKGTELSGGWLHRPEQVSSQPDEKTQEKESRGRGLPGMRGCALVGKSEHDRPLGCALENWIFSKLRPKEKKRLAVARLLRKSQPRLCLDMAAGWRSHGPCPDPPLCRCVLDGHSNSWHSNCSSLFSTVLAPSLIFSGGESHFLCVVGKLAPKTTSDDDLDLASVWTRWVSALGAGGTTRWNVSKGGAVRLQG